MKGLKRFFKSIMGYFQNEKGYTLMEMTAVVAVTATLTALALPVVADKVQQGKLARAAMDVDGLNQALASFSKSLAYWPGDPANPNAPGLTAAVQFLFVGTDGLTPVIGAGTGLGADDNASKHVVTNSTTDTIGTNAIYTACSPTVKSNCWGGPYMGSMKEDPWGNRYLINIQGFYDRTDPSGLGWIMSAGPDGEIETKITDSKLEGDDIGVMAYKARYESQ